MSRWLQAAREAGFSRSTSSASSASSASLGSENPKPAESAEPAECAELLKHPSPDLRDTALTASDPDEFEERAGIIEHDGGLPRQEAEALAAQEQGFDDADSLHRESVGRWAAEIERLATLPAISPDGAEALKRARAFIAEGWALQAARFGWDEVELFGVCPVAPWQRLDRKGAAFGGAVKAVTQEAMVYVGGLRRYRAQVNNDGGATLIWGLAQDNPSSGGDAA